MEEKEKKKVVLSDLHGVDVRTYIKARQEDLRKKPIVENITGKETLFRVGDDIILIMRPFTIARQEKFFIMLGRTLDDLIKSWEVPSKAEDSGKFDAIMQELSKMPFDKLAEIINFVFEREGERAMPLDWIKDNFDLSILKLMVDEVIRLNRLEKIIPFFADLLRGMAKPPKKATEK